MDQPPRPSALLFDMDGLLLDSERLGRRCYVEACEALAHEPQLDAFHRCVGVSGARTREILLDAHGDAFPIATLFEAWYERYTGYVEAGELQLQTGVRELLELVEQRALPRALVTSTRRAHAELKLERTGLASHFAIMVCGGETPNAKPHPDPYLEATRRLSVQPAVSWALEDSNTGAQAALAAGCHTIQVPDLVEPDRSLKVHQRVDDLHAVRDLLLNHL